MNLCLLNLIGKWMGIGLVFVVSLFNFGYKTIENVIINDAKNKNVSYNSIVIDYKTEYVYDRNLPKTHEEIITKGVSGVAYNDGKKEVVLVEPITEVIEIGSGKTGLYTGMLTGYGPDCVGCSSVGNVNCYTKKKTTHSLINDGIYYDDEEFGKVRILSADHREFPCGTIIEINNEVFNKEIGVVLDTGGGMRKAFDSGWILIDMAFEKESLVHSITNKKTNFTVKRWGW
ncbi:MAG: hypothetical protein RR404_00145 [Bacilli bacterium]